MMHTLTSDLYKLEKMFLPTEPIVRFTRPRILFALLTTSTTCEIHERSCEIVIPRSFTEATEFRCSPCGTSV